MSFRSAGRYHFTLVNGDLTGPVSGSVLARNKAGLVRLHAEGSVKVNFKKQWVKMVSASSAIASGIVSHQRLKR